MDVRSAQFPAEAEAARASCSEQEAVLIVQAEQDLAEGRYITGLSWNGS
jgi:hypothetical protein